MKLTNAVRMLLLATLLGMGGHVLRAQTRDPELARLQADLVMRYLEPDPHMALAKYFRDHGKRLEAFYVLEAARRGHFEEEIFNQAFFKCFTGFDNSQAAEVDLLKARTVNPQSADILFKLGDIYISRDQWTKAREVLEAGLEKNPDDFRFVSGMEALLH